MHVIAVNVAGWHGWLAPAAWFYRSLLDNALADPFGGLVTLIAVSVIIRAGRRWWARLARRIWAHHGHHLHRARDWWHAPLLTQQQAHHDEQMAAHATLRAQLGITEEPKEDSP